MTTTHSILKSAFSGIRFKYLTDVREHQHPEYSDDFPGYQLATENLLDVGLDTIFSIEFKADGAKSHYEFTYDSLIAFCSLDEEISDTFSDLQVFQRSLPTEESSARFSGELFFAAQRFLMNYRPRGREIYQVLKNRDLSYIMLSNILDLRWSTWSEVLNERKEAPIYINLLLLSIFRLRELRVTYPQIAAKLNACAFGNKRINPNGRQSTCIPQSKFELSDAFFQKHFTMISFHHESAFTVDQEPTMESAGQLTAGLSFTVLTDDDQVTIHLNIIELVQMSAFAEVPACIVDAGLHNSPVLFDAVKALCWSSLFFIKVSHATIIHVLMAYYIQVEQLKRLNIGKVGEYFSMKTTGETFVSNKAVLHSLPFIIMDGGAPYLPYVKM